MPVGIFSATEKNVFDHTERVHPIYFEFPSEKIDDVTISLPLGWQVSSLPTAQDKDSKVVRYVLKAESDKSTVHLNRQLSVDLLLLEPKYYPALRNFFQLVRTGDEEQVVLQPIGARERVPLAAEGNPLEGCGAKRAERTGALSEGTPGGE